MRGPLAGRTLERSDVPKLLKDTNGQSTEWLSQLSLIQALSLIPLDTPSSVGMKGLPQTQHLSQHLDKGTKPATISPGPTMKSSTPYTET